MRSRLHRIGLVAASIAALPTIALAAEAPAAPVHNGADIAWMLVSAALVMFMVPGLAFFYGGMVRGKNVLSTLMHSMVSMAVISIVWMVIGFSLAFAPDVGGGFVGGLKYLGLSGVWDQNHPFYAATYPFLLFMVFQLMFAAITPALISGAVAERVKFSGYLLFIVLWSILVYAPLAHWVWAEDGWIFAKGALDFAGGTVVHISSGAAALAFAMVLGPRKGHKKEPMPPHNVVYTVLGAGILWFGWFGFNAGSAGPWNGSGPLAVYAFVNTNAGAAGALMSWIILEWIRNGKPTALGAASGAVAGLVAITPAAGYVTPMAAIIIGLIGGAACQTAVSIRAKTNLDDSLDVVGVHFVGGVTGAILTGVFATNTIYPFGAKDEAGKLLPMGLLEGAPSALLTQIIAVVAAALFSFVVSYVLLQIVKVITGIRVTEEEEVEGLDISQHGESAYTH